MNPDNTPAQELIELVRSVGELEQRAVQAYRPVVDDILCSGSRDTEHIERTLDGLLDFCGHESVLAMYKELCRHYWVIDQAATAYYVNAYRERRDSDEEGGKG